MRMALRIGLLLLLGFVINAAVVARAVTWGSGAPSYRSMTAEESRAIWKREVPEVELWSEAEGSTQVSPTMTWTLVGAERGEIGVDWEFQTIWLNDVGWPLRSFRGVQHQWGAGMKQQTSNSGMMVLPDRVLGVPMPGLATAQGRLIPVRPLWGGLAFNMLLHGLAAGAVGWMAMRIRRRARLDRRCCAACRYDLRASLEDDPVRCPECAATYTISVFRRPRQVLRRWMIVYCVPLLVLGGMWLFSDSLRNVRETVRIRSSAPMHYYGWAGLLSMAVLGMIALVSAYSLASRSYADRPKSARIALAAMISLVLTALCVPPVFVFMHGMSAP